MNSEDDSISEAEVGTLELLPENAHSLDRAAIDLQVATAKRYPRSITKSLQEAQELATADEGTAGECFYVLPRAGKKIQGPSARLAEIMAHSWGNLRVQGAIVSEGKRHVTALGTCWDMERNVAYRVEVQRPILDKHGTRYKDDMIGVTSNAAISIALRNAVFKVIPRTYTDRVYKAAQLASVGKGTMDQKRTAAIDWFSKQGIKPEQIYRLLEVDGLDDVGIEEIITLRGVVNAIKDGDTTLELVFNPPKSSAESAKLDEALAGSPEKPTEAAVAGAGTPPTVGAAPAVPPAPEVAPGPAKRVR